MNSHLPSDQDIDRALEVCEMYYTQGMTQQQISRAIGVSRPQVSRILSFARSVGLVTISIKDPRESLKELASNLCCRYGLKDAHVVAYSSDTNVLKRRLGYAAAGLLENMLGVDPQVLGIGRGSTVFQTIQALAISSKARHLTVIPMVGGAGLYNPAFQVNEMAKTTAERMGGDYLYLHAPFFVTTPEIKKAFLQDDMIVKCVSYWDKMDTALVGIGGLMRTADPLFFARVNNAQERTGRRVAADICGRFIDKEGRVVSEEPDVLMAIELDVLRKAHTIVAVAGGRGKEDAIRAALNGGWVDVLITDQWVAQEICRNH
jgi:deoxyribonucleoside regulator